jgi:hypothetical protein
MSYSIGYGKPPTKTRFKKGQSGNPKGRRVGSRNMAKDVEKALARPVTISEGEGKRKISTQEAIVLRLREQALKGDRHAIAEFLKLAERHCPDALKETVEENLDIVDQEILARFKSRVVAEKKGDDEDMSFLE